MGKRNCCIKMLLCFVMSSGGVFVLSSKAQAVDQEKWIEFHGFVNYEVMYDTRQSKTAREGEVYLYPKPVETDSLGRDINATPQLHMFTFHTRMKAQLRGPEVGSFSTSGLIEFDFLGNSDGAVNLIRLRHAYMKLANNRLSIIMGQYWHPMFVPECFPAVVSWGAAIPVHPLSRNPQIRLTYNHTKEWSAMVTVLSQRDFSSAGPNGNSSEYMKNAGIPEIDGQLIYNHNNNFVFGFTAGYKQIAPRIVTNGNISNKEKISSTHFNVFMKFDNKKFTAKLQGIYGQNMSNMLLLGGYAVKEATDPVTDYRTYTNLKTISYWTDIIQKAGAFDIGLFAGYTYGLGADSRPESVGEIYGLGTDIKYMVRIAPRVVYKVKQLKFAFEIYSTGAAFGKYAPDLTITEENLVFNHRFLFSSSFNF